MDIANLVFFINVDLINNPQGSFEASVRTNLCKANNIKEHKIPKFQSLFSSPSLSMTPTIALPLKLMISNAPGKDAHQLCQYIEKAYQDNPIFIFHKLRHHDFHAYWNAIRWQNTYLANQWVVPLLLEGISSALMFYLALDLEELPGSS